MRPTAVIYCRVSSREQVDNFSLGTQEEGCRAYCTREGWEIDQVFVERGESAKTAERPEFQRMLAYCRERKGSVQYVVVYNLSRFARRQYDHHVVRTLLQQLGVGLRSVTEPIEESPLGEMIGGIMASVHEFDNALRRERSITGMKAAVRNGKWCWHPPFGYVNVDGALEVDEAKASAVREAYARVAVGEPTDAVWRDLRGRGAVRVCRSDFYKLLANPIYAGWVEAKSWGIRSRGQHQAIVDQQAWDRVQTIHAGEGVKYRSTHPDFPLRRFVRCGHCGEPLTGGWSRGRNRRYGYYRCTRTKGCPTGNVRREDLEEAFLSLMESVQPSERYLELFREVCLAELEDQKEEREATRRAAEWEARRIEKHRRRLFDAYVYDEAIDQKTYGRELDRISEAEALNRMRLHEAQIEEIDAEGVLRFAEHLARNAARLWLEFDPQQRQRFQGFVFPRGLTLMDGELLNPEISPLFQEDRGEIVPESENGRREWTGFEPHSYLHALSELQTDLRMEVAQ